MVLVQSIRDQTSSRVAPQIGRGFSSKTQRIQPAPDWLRVLLRNGRGFSMKSKWIKLAPGRQSFRVTDHSFGPRYVGYFLGHTHMVKRIFR